MAYGKIAIAAALLLGVSGGAALAQLDAAEQSFYADPVLPDPPPAVAHPHRAPEVTADVAAVAPALTMATPLRPAACTAINPCAVASPAARG